MRSAIPFVQELSNVLVVRSVARLAVTSHLILVSLAMLFALGTMRIAPSSEA